MYQNTKRILVDKALTKVNFFHTNPNKYFLAAIVSGLYIGIAYFFTLVIGDITKGVSDSSLYKVTIAICFTMALNLVIFAGSELFTGNNMLMVNGVLDKKVSVPTMWKLWITCYIGNLVGSIIIVALLLLSGSANEGVKEIAISLTAAKTSYSITSMFFKGILCNFMVCLGALCAYIMKEEIGKITLMFWCIFSFVVSGFEHSIANMSLFAMGWFWDQGATLSLSNTLISFFWVTLGNIIGGGMVGAIYHFLGTNKEAAE